MTEFVIALEAGLLTAPRIINKEKCYMYFEKSFEHHLYLHTNVFSEREEMTLSCIFK